MTQESIELRLLKHNQSFYGLRYTSKTDDWELYFVIPCNSIEQAINIERHIKKMKSKKYIENLKMYPEISQKLLEKFKSN